MPEQSREHNEIKGIFEGIIMLIKEVNQYSRELYDYILTKIDGGSIGEDIAKFYKSLINNGVPEELAEKMTTKYLEERFRVFEKILNRTTCFPQLVAGKPSNIIKLWEEKGRNSENT